METNVILWRRLDEAGHDACRLLQKDDGWSLKGAAVFQHEGAAACLAYMVDCDNQWRTRSGLVQGWVGKHSIEIQITRSPDGLWIFDGLIVPNLKGCVDLDLGFTPATNLFQLRRIALEIGQAADVAVAWLDAPAGALNVLHQRYERRTVKDYWYEAPRFDYFALLQVDEAGFIEKYPNLWEKET